MSRSLPTMMSRRQFGAALGALAIGGRVLEDAAHAQLFQMGDSDDGSMLERVTETLGGNQVWADVAFFHDWRIQRSSLTGQHQLLDGSDHQRARGTLADCRQALDAIRRRDRLPPMQGKAVVVLHGLFRTRSSMRSLCDALEKGNHYTTFNVGYPTTRGSVAEHAAALDSVIRSLEGIGEINFVGHSLGNLVVRHWLGDLAAQKRALPAGQKFGRMVMLAPPNDHPKIAAKLLNSELATFFTGPASEQLATGWEKLAPKLATPPFDFGIIAGGRGNDRGFNPLLGGDNDGTITVRCTRLAGARDFRLLPVLHSFVMSDARAQQFTRRFLEQGHFETDATRRPIQN